MHANEETPVHGPDYPLVHPVAPLTLGTPESPFPLLMVSEGSACTVRDDRGNEYLDGAAGLWNTHLGLGNAEIIDAITQQLQRLSYGTLFAFRSNEPALELARELRSLMPPSLSSVYLTGSGSESTDLAIRIAVLYNVLRGQREKKALVYLDQSYHGTFAGSISVSGLFPLRQYFQQGGVAESIPTPNTLQCPPDQSYADFALSCADALEEKAKAGSVAAFIIEPILASAGVVAPPRAYFDRIQAICRQYDILLIVDEVCTGFGRTGRWFAFEHYDLAPDIVLLSKGINSGYLPLGAVVFSRAIADVFREKGFPMLHGSTANGHPACCASALANIEIIRRERLVERANGIGSYLHRALESLASLPAVKEVRGIGLMLGVVLAQTDGTPATSMQLFKVMQLVQQMGVLLYVENSVLSFSPALTVTESEVDYIVGATRCVLENVELVGGEVTITNPLPERHPVPSSPKTLVAAG
jgi:adenosylmethionine-8-amino-7-oxononanoate aminotransferase